MWKCEDEGCKDVKMQGSSPDLMIPRSADPSKPMGCCVPLSCILLHSHSPAGKLGERKREDCRAE